MAQPPVAVDAKLTELMAASGAATVSGDAAAAWRCLEDAHVLSQQWARRHVRVHWAMLRLGWREGMPREVVGQLARLVMAGPASIVGRYPRGNRGRAAESAFTPAPLDATLAALLQDPGPGEGVLDDEGVRRLYDRVAPFYDLAAAPYGWSGAGRLVRGAIGELRLGPGDTVVDLGTGTGRNLIVLAELVGPDGRVIGVDISPGMLERARGKVERRGLTNVEMVEADMATFVPPAGTDGVLATFAIEMAPDYEEIIRRLAHQLSDGARISVCGLRHPDRWPEWVVRLGSAINRPFGVSDAYRSHRPWEALGAHTVDTIYEEALGGAAYLCAGSTPPKDT